MRFGMPYDAIPAGPCHCDNKRSYNIDKEGYHILSGCNLGNQRQTTHNAVVKQLCSMLTHAGIINRTEDTQIIQSVELHSKKRMDITADNFAPGISLNIDVSITDPRQLHLSKAIPGKAAEMREIHKKQIYGQIYKKAGHMFSPFVIESFGRWGSLAKKTFRAVMDYMAVHGSQAFSHLPKSRVVNYWRAKVTMAMHRQACIGVHQRIQSIIQSRQGVNKKEGQPLPVSERYDPCAVLCAFDSCG
jgi:hypothetical protein